MKIGDKVEYVRNPAYCGEVIGIRKGGNGWWVMGEPHTKGATPAMAKGNSNMTPEVWNQIVGRVVVVWNTNEKNLRLVGASQDVTPAAVRQELTGYSGHVAGLSPETIDWSAHRAFFRGE